MRVAETAIASPGDAHLLADRRQIGDWRFIVLLVNLRSCRHLEHDIPGIGPSPKPPHPMAAGGRLEMLLVAVVNQGVATIDGFNPDIAALAAIAAVRATAFYELLAPERHGTRAPVS